MTFDVLLTLTGTQNYPGADPDTIQLVTDGTMDIQEDRILISYRETDLTGMDGVTTQFDISREDVRLKRTGKLNSEMIFREGESYDSLYEMEFGALMLTVCARKVECHITESGGYLDLTYSIDIENGNAGIVDYHLEIKRK